MTPKPEPEWRACPCAVKSYRDTPPWAYRWCRLLPCGRVAVSRPTCLACPVPDCDAALEAAIVWIQAGAAATEDETEEAKVVRQEARDALAKLRGGA